MPAARPAVALAGCGYWGRNVARNLHQLGQLAAVCDPDRAVLAKVRDSHPGVRTFQSVEPLLEDPKVKAIAVAAPAAQHYAIVKKALAAGKDVFVEKPLALRVA
jgi:UDP-2-acetamido-3-amino-2,3-dideoxy-glucuronate N-acetyltransferase